MYQHRIAEAHGKRECECSAYYFTLAVKYGSRNCRTFSAIQNKSLCVPVRDSSSKSSCSLYWYTNSQSGVMWHSRKPP